MSRKTNLAFAAVAIAVCILGAPRVSCAGVVFEVGADTPVVKAQKGQRVIVRARVRPDENASDKTVRERRVPLAVALVLDKSGSMASDGKMENAKLGAVEALKMLTDRDVAAVVVYDSEASVAVSARAASNQDVFARVISRVSPGGATALYDGVETGAEQIEPFIKDGYVPRVILLSDGIANCGPSTTYELSRLARRLARQGMTITTIGLGLDYNEDLMTALASESGGNAYFARHAEQLSERFAADINDAVTLTARKTRVTLKCGGRARPVRVIGRSASEYGDDGDSITVSIDNLYRAEKYAMFEIEITETESAEVFDAATVRLEYVDAATGELVAREVSLTLSFTKDDREVAKNRDPEIVSQAEVAHNAEVREEVVRFADEGRAAEAVQVLRERAEALKQFAPSAGASAPALSADAKEFESMADGLNERGRMSSESRKETLNKAYTQKNQQTPVSESKKD
ncbi:hypothetical protein FACS1894187_07510 [Synergistales bacterium]|nr:hypothetical protein FACS1894187_07510 [Synergistales bacterium]